MPEGFEWWHHPHHEGPGHHHPCDCEPRRVLVTVTISDAQGNVRAVRDTEYFVRPHHHHEQR